MFNTITFFFFFQKVDKTTPFTKFDRWHQWNGMEWNRNEVGGGSSRNGVSKNKGRMCYSNVHIPTQKQTEREREQQTNKRIASHLTSAPIFGRCTN